MEKSMENLSFSKFTVFKYFDQDKDICSMTDSLHNIFQYIESEYANNNEFYEEFLYKEDEDSNRYGDIKNVFEYRDNILFGSSMFVLYGPIGAGKTSFIESWAKDKKYCKIIRLDNVINDWKYTKVTPEDLLANEFSRQLRMSVNEDIDRYFDDYIRKILEERGEKTTEETLGEFKMKFIQQIINCRFSQPVDLLHGLIHAYNTKNDKPIWLILDNVDQEDYATHEKYINGLNNLNTKLRERSFNRNIPISYHLLVVVRKDTYLKEQNLRQYDAIKFPMQDILGIVLKKIEDSLIKATNIGNIKIEKQLLIGECVINDTDDLNKLINLSIIDSVKNLEEEQPSYNSIKFHNDLVNYNTRSFIKFWQKYIITGNFEKLLKYHYKNKSNYFNQYMRGIIRGQYEYFSGNKNIDALGSALDAPIIFNIYGLELEHAADFEKILNNYMLFHRLLQYIDLYKNNGVTYSNLNQDLCLFYNQHDILQFLKYLLWIGLITEERTGARYVGENLDYKKIKLESYSLLVRNGTTSLYLDIINSNYEYISAMAFVSPILIEYYKKDILNLEESVLSGNITLNFLQSLLKIILINLKNYQNDGTIEKFKAIFFKSNKRPWKNSVESSIKALEKKQEKIYTRLRDEKKSQERMPSRKLISLENESTEILRLLTDFRILLSKGNEALGEILGDDYYV
jgi:hypothetical protein